jgi:hypothetical protein
MNKQHGRAFALDSDGEIDPVHGNSSSTFTRRGPCIHELPEIRRNGSRFAFPIDADEYKLCGGNQSVIPNSASGLADCEAGSAMMSQRLMEPEHVSRIRSGTIVYGRLADGGPGTISREDVHARSAGQHLPTGALEKREKRCLIQMTKGIALVRIDGEIDFLGRHRQEDTPRTERGEVASRCRRSILHPQRGRTSDEPSFPTARPMKPATDYIRHAARLARKLQMDAAMGTPTPPDAEFYKTLSKALEEIAAGLEMVAERE